MPSEISTFILSQPQTQTLQSNNNPDNETLQPGLFDAFISEYILTEENTTEQIAVPNIDTNVQETTTQPITFTGSNSFPQSVIDILAGISEGEEFTHEIPDKIIDIKNGLEDIHDDVQGIIADIKAVVSEKISAFKSELPKKLNELVSQVLNDESIPEDTKQEIMNLVDDLVKELKDSDLDLPDETVKENVQSLIVKVSDIIHEHISPQKVSPVLDEADSVETVERKDVEEEDDDDDEDTDEVRTDDNDTEVNVTSLSVSGAAMMPNAVFAAIPSPSDTVSVGTQPEIPTMNQSSQQNVQIQTVLQEPKPTTPKVNAKPQNESEIEAVNPESEPANFDEHLEISDNQNRTPNQNENQDNNPSGQENNSSEHEQSNETRITSPARNDTRRTSTTTSSSTSRTQNERRDTNTPRTESRNTFQSFFEGVLSTRRNASRTSPLPLNLQTATYTLNQSQTLRDGMINVVRFIRADGVQKANVVIDPPALGRISVELSSTSSGVEASIKVASEQIRQLVQDQLSELRMNLSQQGVQVAEFTVDVQQDNSNGNHQGNQYGNEQRTFAINEADDESEEFRIDLEEGLLYWIA